MLQPVKILNMVDSLPIMWQCAVCRMPWCGVLWGLWDGSKRRRRDAPWGGITSNDDDDEVVMRLMRQNTRKFYFVTFILQVLFCIYLITENTFQSTLSSQCTVLYCIYRLKIKIIMYNGQWKSF